MQAGGLAAMMSVEQTRAMYAGTAEAMRRSARTVWEMQVMRVGALLNATAAPDGAHFLQVRMRTRRRPACLCEDLAVCGTRADAEASFRFHALKGEPLARETASKTDEMILSWAHNASSAP